MLSAVLFIGCFEYQCAGATNTLGEGEAEITNAVLQGRDLQGITISMICMRPWWKGTTNTKGIPDEIEGVEQCATLNKIRVLIHYAEFATIEDARQAVDFYPKGVASIFKKGLWDDKKAVIGDELWCCSEATGSALLIRTGNICVFVDCQEGIMDQQKRVAEMIGNRIVEKVKLGARVIVPSVRQKKETRMN
jgi:hypothetical protein